VKKISLLIFISTLLFSSCSSSENQNQQSNNNNKQPVSSSNQNVTPLTSPTPSIAQSPSPKLSPSPTAQPSVSPTPGNNAEVKYYKGKGVVTEINLDQVWIGLDHEKIEGFMEAMIMQIYVKDKSMIESLKIGDKVEFTLEVKGPTEVITAIKKL